MIWHRKNEKPLSRNSQDIKNCARGACLLDMCRFLDFLILNGRKTGDIFGKCTSFQWNGSSVVDYVITAASSFYRITTLGIGSFLPWLFNHCPLKFNFTKKRGINIKSHKENNLMHLWDIAPTFIWNPSTKETFENKLQSDAIKEKFENISTGKDKILRIW